MQSIVEFQRVTLLAAAAVVVLALCSLAEQARATDVSVTATTQGFAEAAGRHTSTSFWGGSHVDGAAWGRHFDLSGSAHSVVDASAFGPGHSAVQGGSMSGIHFTLP